MHVQDVEDQGDVVRIAACASTVEASCPECGVSSARMHSRYRRTLRDLAACGRPLVIELDVRRFRCGEAACGRKIFADRFHLWQNLAQALEKTVRAHRSCLQEAPDPNTAMQEETGGEAEPAERPRTVDSYRNERPMVARTQERYAQVQALKNNGASLNAISRELGLASRTARKYATATSVDELLAPILAAPASWTGSSPTSPAGGTRAAPTPPSSTPRSRPTVSPAADAPSRAGSSRYAGTRKCGKSPARRPNPAASPAGPRQQAPPGAGPGSLSRTRRRRRPRPRLRRDDDRPEWPPARRLDHRCRSRRADSSGCLRHRSAP
ncbi:transposase family protein [Nonomuraea guangzhouensis]|uniref:Transposase family protein n=1 Tax=Nonomuraea guangzhouensis TaxID=1291555 RepID=A0ABW4GTD5_9ACTN